MNTNTLKQNFVNISNLYDKAYNAHIGTSFYPEERAAQIVNAYEGLLNDDLKVIPENEHERYIENYKKYLFSWLDSKSKCISTMITGAGNFPVKKADEANRMEKKRYDEFGEWREKAKKAIQKRIEDEKTIEQKRDEKAESLKEEIAQKIEWGSVANCYGLIERLAFNGEVELVKECIIVISEYNNTHIRPFMTSRHKVWKLPEIAEKIREKNQLTSKKESESKEINGVKVIKNFKADRLQLFFDGKPKYEMIQTLKKNAFKWAPTSGCWQRQLTQDAIFAAERLLK